MADEHRIDVDAVEKEKEYGLSALKVSDDQLLGALKVEKEENSRERVPATIKIQRVPEIMLRNEDFRACYKPMELSIGPIHASDPNLFKMELKVRLAAEFIKVSGEKEEDLLERIKENIQDLKKSFNEEVINSYSDEFLARLLFLDGCATLQFIFSFLDESLNKFGINNGQANLIQQDLFLLENQIPYLVFELLINLGQESEHLRERLLGFVLMNNVLATAEASRDLSVSHFEQSHIPYHQGKYSPVHLLDLLRLVLSSSNAQMQDSVCENICIYCLEHSCCCPSILCDIVIFSLLVSLTNLVYREHSFRNVQELKAAGITLKPSDSCSLRSVSFHTHFCFRGRLKLPPLVVDGSTTRKLLNLLAYEMCHPDYQINGYGIVASYVSLLDLLIDNEDDVKDLRAANIIRHRLSSDMEVAKLFNSLGSVCIAPPLDSYKHVKSDVEKHYKRKFVIWMAQVYRIHFNSPWTILALFAAITILVLTATQTYYAIHSKN